MTLATVAQPQTKLAPQLDERAVAVQQLHKPHALGFGGCPGADCLAFDDVEGIERDAQLETLFRSEEHTSELQSLMRISYAVFCLKQKKPIRRYDHLDHHFCASTAAKLIKKYDPQINS